MFNLKVYLKHYRIINKQKIKLQQRRYYLKNKKRMLNQMKSYNKIHRIELKNYRKNHRKERKEYYIKNKIKQLLQQNKRDNFKRKYNILYRITCNLRSRVWHVLKNHKKVNKTIKLLGCSVKQLKLHLEKHFKPGMSWNNYGKWHIDHIKPCAKFNLSVISEQRLCFHYTNLQPLWAEENLRKGSK